MATLAMLPAAFICRNLALAPALFSPTFTAFRSLPTEMPCPFTLRRARMYIGVGAPPVIAPVLIR
jgi:hypothetical protein